MNQSAQKTVFAALCLALGLLFPFLTAQLQSLGNMLLPMHFPVLFCGLLCGWQYGGAVGLILPLLRSLLFGRPPLYPTALAMSAELLTYGLVAGLLYLLFRKKGLVSLYVSLLGAMLTGRIVWGIVQAILQGLSDKPFTLAYFWTEAFLLAWPGILLQLILIPPAVAILQKMQQKAKRS